MIAATQTAAEVEARRRSRAAAWRQVQRARLFGSHIRSYPDVAWGEAEALLRVERAA